MAKKVSETKAKGPSGLEVAKKAIAKKYGEDAVRPMSAKPRIIDTVSTRSLGLDAALGRGGVALGRIYEFYGPTGSGKTTLAMSIIAEAQAMGMTCVFVDAEHTSDPELFEAMGVDTDALEMVERYTGEDNLTIAETLMATGEVDVMVIDSVSALVPQVAADAALDDTNIALLARLMSKTTNRFAPIAAETNTLVIFINQVRNKIGGYGNPEVTTGGGSLPFYATGRVRVDGIGAKANRIVDGEGTVIGHKTKFEIVKNKLAAPFKVSEVNLIYGKGYDTMSELVTIATDLGVLTKSGSWYKYNGENVGQGENAVYKFFEDNLDVFLVIQDDVTNILGLKKFYDAQVEAAKGRGVGIEDE